MDKDEKPQDEQTGEDKAPEKKEETPPAPDPTKDELEATRKELETLKKEKKDREDADLTEKEREKKRADEAEALAATREERLRRVSIIQSVRDTAPDLKVDLDLEAVKDLYEAGAFKGIKLDDKTGEPLGIADLLKQLIKSKPYLVKKSTVAAPDINADKTGDEKPGEMTQDRKDKLKKRFRLKG